MTAWLISCAVYGLFGYVVIKTHDKSAPDWLRRLGRWLAPRWLRRFGRWLRRLSARALAAIRLRRSLPSFSLHLLLSKGVSHR